MLDKLEKVGWTIDHEDQDVIIYACFDDGFWSYVRIWTNASFRAYYEDNKGKTITNDGGVTNEAYIITSVTLHRLTDSYEHVEDKVMQKDVALTIVYDVCQSIAKRFNHFCDDSQT